MDYLTLILERNRQAAPRETPWPEEPREVLWYFPASDPKSARRTPAAAEAAPDEALEAALEEAERTVARLTRHLGEGSVFSAMSGAQKGRSEHPAVFAPGVGKETFESLSAALDGVPAASVPAMEEISRYFERDARRYG